MLYRKLEPHRDCIGYNGCTFPSPKTCLNDPINLSKTVNKMYSSTTLINFLMNF